MAGKWSVLGADNIGFGYELDFDYLKHVTVREETVSA